jgi:hypothetical protein
MNEQWTGAAIESLGRDLVPDALAVVVRQSERNAIRVMLDGFSASDRLLQIVIITKPSLAIDRA